MPGCPVYGGAFTSQTRGERVVFMDEEGKQTRFFSHVAISSGASDRRSDPLMYNFNRMSRLYL